MRRFVVLSMMLLAIMAKTGAQTPPPPPPPPPPPGHQPEGHQPRTVTVTAEGFSKEDALHQALRKALEQGAGTQIASFSKVENFVLARDTIYSRATGIVSEYDIVRQEELSGGTWEVTVRATVRPSAVAAAWGEVQNVLAQIGRPQIMVWIDEKIDGRVQDESVVASRIEELFTKVGFDLVSRRAIEDIRRRAAHVAEAKGDQAELTRLAKETGAHIFIRGHAHADRAGIEDLYGVSAAFYNCDVQLQAYYTDTGRLLTSQSAPVTRRGVRSRHEFSPQAARAALTEATFPRSDRRREPALATKLYEAVMEQWATQITAGSDIELQVAGLEFKAYLNLKRALEGLERVKSVAGDFSDRTGRFRIKALFQAEQLAERLTEPPFDQWMDIHDLKLNRIEARGKVEPDGP